MSRRLRVALQRFAADRTGLAAVEFALILPMMCLLLLGSVELTQFPQANRRLENAASSLADVISRDSAITDAEMDGIWIALGLLMWPNNDDAVDVRITSIEVTSDTDAEVVWSEVRGTTYEAMDEGESITLADNMMQPGTAVIRVDASMNYMPAIGFFFLEGPTLGSDRTSHFLAHTSFRRGRETDRIERSDD